MIVRDNILYENQIKRYVRTVNTTKISTSKDAAAILRELYEEYGFVQEIAFALYLDNNNQVINDSLISIGSTAATLIDLKLVLRGCITNLANNLVISHSHISSNTSPSQADIALTKRLKEVTKVLDVRFLDHLILTQDSYYLFQDEGLI